MELSVILLTYNSDRQAIRKTLNSIFSQEGIEFEVIAADDGSALDPSEFLYGCASKKQFDRFRVIRNPENRGTVRNLFSAVKEARGTFVKAIAAGDAIYAGDTMKRWTEFMKEHDLSVSFSDAVAFLPEEPPRITEVRPAPANVDLYEGKPSRNKTGTAYLLANDTALGAALLFRRDVLEAYLSRMADRVRYAEDFAVRLMVFDGIIPGHYPEKGIWYEYGTGISSAKKKKWAEALKKDFDATEALILETETATDRWANRYRNYLRKRKDGFSGKVRKICAFPLMPYYRWRMKRSGRKTRTDGDLRLLTGYEEDPS